MPSAAIARCYCGVCAACVIRTHGAARRRFLFTEELLQQLHLAYAAKTKRDLSLAITALAKKTGWPRYIFRFEAIRQGWSQEVVQRRWSEAEIAFLREKLGEYSVKQIARKLGRSHESVMRTVQRLQLSARVSEGYTLQDLQRVLGVSYGVARRWVDRGLLGKPMVHGHEVRIPDLQVLRFLRVNPHEYDLRRVDQAWFKSMVFAKGD